MENLSGKGDYTLNMKCRALFEDENTGKQNIVWFGSAGKNMDFVPAVFENNPPIIIENGKRREFSQLFDRYWLLTEGPVQNGSSTWNEDLLRVWPDYEGPTEDMGIYYYLEKESEPGTCFVFYSEPTDFVEIAPLCKIAKFERNDNPVFDLSATYYLYQNKIPASNYSTDQHGVRDSLIQRLSVIKGELWYKASYGLPLMDKIKNKGIYDTIVVNIITSHPDVTSLLEFESTISRASREYQAKFSVTTVYGETAEIAYSI